MAAPSGAATICGRAVPAERSICVAIAAALTGGMPVFCRFWLDWL